MYHIYIYYLSYGIMCDELMFGTRAGLIVMVLLNLLQTVLMNPNSYSYNRGKYLTHQFS